jgi:putative phage-type endonuclease
MEIIKDWEQLSPEWFAVHVGRLGGSTIKDACAKGQGKSRANLLYRKAGEILSGEAYEGYFNENMQRGIDLEPEARRLYELVRGVDVEQVAVVLSDDPHKLCSPDGLVGDSGIIEIKCVIPSVHIETIDKDRIPAQYRKQIQWGLSICQRDWCDFISYCPKIVGKSIFIKRTQRDEKLIKELHEGANAFIEDMVKLVERIKNGK